VNHITKRISTLAAPVLLIAFAGCPGDAPPPPVAPAATLDRYLAGYAPYEMSFDASALPGKEKQMLRKLVEAAAYLDTAYRMQTSVYGLRLRDSLAALPPDTLRTKLLALIDRNGGPFELLHGDTAFIGTETSYPGQEFYPRGMTARQFEDALAKLPDAEKEAFLSRYTVIREDGSGGYRAVPFHVEYARWVGPMARLLKEAADLSDDQAFARFLRLKAEALLTDRHFDADTAWVGLSGNRYDIIFGPDEEYSDGVRGIKGKYQANIEVVDAAESKRLDLYTAHLNAMERNLPVGDEYKSVIDGVTSGFVVVTDIARTGEAAVGYQAVATNLPNDPEVHQRKGTKKTFWKNMLKARYNTIIRPVALRLLNPEQLQFLTNDGFFQVVLMHEISHALGPRLVKVGPDRGKPVNLVIGPEHSALEEAKADLAGLHSLVYLMDRKVVDRAREREFFVSYLGSLFRTIRFGIGEAHGKAAAISLNYLVANGGIVYDAATKRWSVDFNRIRAGVERLTRELIILEGNGDPDAVKAFFAKWVTMTDALSTSMAAAGDIAVDILPKYSVRWE
jgi:hypothetical protein